MSKFGQQAMLPAQLTDLAPTLLELLDIEPSSEFSGRSLVRPLFGLTDPRLEHRPMIAETFYPRIEMGPSSLYNALTVCRAATLRSAFRQKTADCERPLADS